MYVHAVSLFFFRKNVMQIACILTFFGGFSRKNLPYWLWVYSRFLFFLLLQKDVDSFYVLFFVAFLFFIIYCRHFLYVQKIEKKIKYWRNENSFVWWRRKIFFFIFFHVFYFYFLRCFVNICNEGRQELGWIWEV